MKSEPIISARAHIARESVIVGDVTIGDDSSVFYYSVLRGDSDRISIGARTNIQEHCTLHVDEGFPLTLGDDVTVGHGCILHGCEIGDCSLIGMGSTVMNGAKIGRNCLIGAGSLVTQNAVIPDGSIALGRPAKVIRELTPEQITENARTARHYVDQAKELF